MKVGIVGAATYSDEHFESDGWEYWGVNNCFADVERCRFTRWFELHTFRRQGRALYRRDQVRYRVAGELVSVKEYLKAIDALKIPVYMQKKNRLVRQSRVFPFQEIMDRFGTDYFGCSFAWMIALAIMEGATDIALHGMALSGAEYYYQRPSVEFFLGLALGKGISIHNAQSSELLRGPWIYAFAEPFTAIDALYGRNMTSMITGMTICAQDYARRLLEMKR